MHGLVDAQTGNEANGRKRQYPYTATRPASHDRDSRRPQGYHRSDLEQQRDHDEPQAKRAPGFDDYRRGQTEYHDSSRGSEQSSKGFGLNQGYPPREYGDQRREGPRGSYGGTVDRREGPQMRSTYDSANMYGSKGDQPVDSNENFWDAPRRDDQSDYSRDRGTSIIGGGQDRFYSQKGMSQNYGHGNSRNDQLSQYRSDGRRDISRTDDYTKQSAYPPRPIDADQGRSADSGSGLQGILDSRAGKRGPSDTKAADGRPDEREFRSRPFFGETGAPYQRLPPEGKVEASGYSRGRDKQVFDYKNESYYDKGTYDQMLPQSVEQQRNASTVGRRDNTEGYSNRPTDPYSSYQQRDSYGSSTQRPDAQRSSYPRDQYSDDSRRSYPPFSSGTELRGSSDQYSSPGAKRDFPSREDLSYRDQPAIDSKRGRYTDFPSSYQPSQSHHDPPEKRSADQADIYSRPPPRGYGSDSYSSGRYEPSRYDTSTKPGGAEAGSSSSQNRGSDQR